jgi:hypothetical protein
VASWRRDLGLRLEVDLSASSLAGVRLGDPLEAVARFGPPGKGSDPCKGVFKYPSEGFEVDVDMESRLVEGLCFFWNAGWWATGERPFFGSFSLDGTPADLGPLSPESRVKGLLGEPYWRDSDDDETILYYVRGPVEWQLEFPREGRLRAFLMVSPPSMADASFRDSLGVTRPWPPGVSA